MPDQPALLPSPLQTAAQGGADDGVRARIERQLEMLGELAELGLEVARIVERRAKAVDAGTSDADLQGVAMAYARVARAVRMTLLLQSRLINELKSHEMAAAREAALALRAEDRARLAPHEEHKARVERIVERVAKAQVDDEDEVERLVDEAGERLDDDDIYGDVTARPIGELVALVCRDLGLDPDWTRLADEAWAQAEIEGGAAGWPPVRVSHSLEHDGDDRPAVVRLTGHPHPRPFPHQGGREASP
jgi:hypothetical protein